MNFDVHARTILLVTHGSHAYGLNTPSSDIDVKGVCIEPEPFHLGFLHKFEQLEKMAAKGHTHDLVVYSLKKFAFLAANCNPNIIEILHVADSDVRTCDRFGELLRRHRNDFLSKKAKHTFSGYAHAQLKRIRTHKRWNDNPPDHMPLRSEYGLPERTLVPKDHLAAANAAIQKTLDGWQLEGLEFVDEATRILIQAKVSEVIEEIVVGGDPLWMRAARTLGFSDDFIHILDQERAYENAKREYTQFKEWEKSRNPARAALEKKHGYDTKHGMHLMRLMRMCREILRDGEVRVKRHDRDELMDIRNGGWSFDRLLGEAKTIEDECNELYKKSPLPNEPNRNQLNDLVVGMTRDYLKLHG